MHLNDERAAVEGSAAMVARATTAILLDNGVQLTDLLLSGVLPRFPTLNFVSVESGMGFIPFCLDSADYHFKQVRVDKQKPEFTMLPSEYYRRQVYATFWFEQVEQHHLDRLTADTLMFETDYPHSTCLGPRDVQAGADFALAGVTAEVAEKIRWRNAAALFKVPPPPEGFAAGA
jgi:predicted TIM-barrel fold metal-dependent hydrolase